MVNTDNKQKDINASLPDSRPALTMAGIFKALGEPNRLRIVQLLRSGELCAGDIARLLKIDQSALSHQLKILKYHGIVISRKDGIYHWYSLENPCVRELLDLMDQHLVHC